ncbi:thioester reductase domain-containing protein [Calothrix sp. PCC 6303]|uniref:thioester reductase domain-containing protein n=1 Tax=Calothrix sp. PCC 6303 TaxID=1170562 RepID=UPI0002A05915|nr:thioester reductase domain-containing protein [Calothrix sp. PCC 6303]AFZ00728.1 thioester reductase domain protein [Calothrix sp. PCC 6303]
MVSPKKSMTAEEIQVWMAGKLAELLKVEVDEVDVNLPLEDYGLDSARAMVLVGQVEKKLGVELSPVLLWHYPTIAALSVRLAEDSEDVSDAKSTGVSVVKPLDISVDLGAEVVLDPSIYPAKNSFRFNGEPENVFVTGATGFLGGFIIYELLKQTSCDVYCLVRAANTEAGKIKLKKNLEQYAIWDDEFEPRIIPILGDLSQPLLGISQEGFEMLAANMDAIYHSAATLNYVYPYSALKTANVLGTQEVLRMACMIRVKPVHYVSSVAVFESSAYAGKIVKEDDAFEHWQGIFLGYSQTKWVAEKLVKAASDRGLPVTIHRPPLIGGDSQTGVCNGDDFINLMIKGCIQMGAFPDVDYKMDFSPVDYVSKAIVHLSRQKESLGKAFHLQHPQPVPLKELVEWISSFGFSVKSIPYKEWQQKLTEITDNSNPLYTLRPFLLERWSKEQLTIPDLYLQTQRPIISCQATLHALSGSGVSCPPIDSRLFMTYSAYLIQSGFLSFGS